MRNEPQKMLAMRAPSLPRFREWRSAARRPPERIRVSFIEPSIKGEEIGFFVFCRRILGLALLHFHFLTMVNTHDKKTSWVELCQGWLDNYFIFRFQNILFYPITIYEQGQVVVRTSSRSNSIIRLANYPFFQYNNCQVDFVFLTQKKVSILITAK